MVKISIIVPVYNVENYIGRCLDSCVNQINVLLGKDYEVICVNDGSTDNSATITRKYEQEYYGIKVISQENQGLSGARNTGILHSSGEYIWFVDSDDWIENDSIITLLPYLDSNNDLIEIQYQNVYEDGHIIVDEEKASFNGVVTGIDATIAGGVHTGAPFSIYRSQFLKDNHLSFVRGIYHEDVEFKPRVLLLAKNVCSIPNILYNYYRRTSGSITSNYKLKNGLDLLNVLQNHYLYVQSYDKKVQTAIYNQLSMWINTILLGIHELKGEDYCSLKNKLKQHKDLFYAMRRSNKLKYQLEGLFLGFNVKFGLWLHSKLR